MDVLPEIVGKDQPDGVTEDLLQVQVDAARGPVVVDVRVHVEAGVQEHDEGLDAAAVEGEPFVAEEGVVDDALDVDGPHGHPAHVGIAQDIVHVVRGVDPREERLEVGQPAGMGGLRFRVALAHEIADPLRVNVLSGLEGAGRATALTADQITELLGDDALAELLVGEVEIHEKIVVEEVPEGTVADVVQETRHPQQLFDESGRRRIGKLRLERGVKLLGEATRQVHGAEGMLESAVLGGGKDPARRLELRHAAEALHPGGVDQVLLGRLPGDAIRARVEDVLVDGVGDEPAPLIGVHATHAGTL